jgi:integrase/recombinase XerD
MIMFQSTYYKFWYENVDLTAKKHVILYLRKFETYLKLQGFEGELDFDRFHASHNHPGKFLPIQESFIDKFIVHLRDECQSSKFVLYNAVSSLKNFFEFLFEMGLIHHHPMMNYPNPFYHRPIKNTALSKDECLELLHAAVKRDPFFRHEFVLVWFMLVTGLRNSEIRSLRRSKVNLDSRMVRVNEGQKNSSRLTSITYALAGELRRYINHPSYPKLETSRDDLLFSHEGKQISSYSLGKIIRRLCSDAGIRNATPHDLRRTAGYLMQSGGMNIIEIQKQLGHKILATTLRYIPPIMDLLKILESLEPV